MQIKIEDYKNQHSNCTGQLVFKFQASGSVLIEKLGIINIQSPMYLKCNKCNFQEIPLDYLAKIKLKLIKEILEKPQVTYQEILFISSEKLPKLVIEIDKQKDLNDLVSEDDWNSFKKRLKFIYWGNRNQPLYLR